MGRCVQCRFYYVTWQANTPHGCKAYGFMTAGPPDEKVFEMTSTPCQLRQDKVLPQPNPSQNRRNKFRKKR